MSLGDALQAVAAAVVWGLSFIAIKYGVEDAPPFLLSALRFTFAAFPLALFLRPPRARPSLIAAYGLMIGVGQFGLLFFAVKLGMPVGLASLVIQLQVFLTVFFAWFALGERPTRAQTIGGAVAFLGIAAIGAARLKGAEFLPFALTVAAASCWAIGNLIGKFVGRVDPLAFMAWSSLVAPAPMFALSLWADDGRTLPALLHPTLRLIVSVAVLSYGATLFGFGLWSRLLMRYTAATVAPYALLVPVVGMLAAWLLFGETSRPIELAGALLIMAGLAVNVLGERLRPPLPGPKG